MSVIVGSLIGSGQPAKARQYAALGMVMVFALGVVNACWAYLFGDKIAAFFTDSAEVQEVFRTILPYAILFHLADAPQSNALGILRGIGMQRRGAISIAVGYGVIGMPLGWFMCFYLRWGVAMLWLGPVIGCVVGGWPLCYNSIFRTDWSKFTVSDGAETAVQIECSEVAPAVTLDIEPQSSASGAV